MLTYFQCQTLCGKRGSKRMHGRATYLIERPDGDFAVEYHSRPVVVIHKDGTYTLPCGYKSATTKSRINEYSPVYVYQCRGTMYVKGLLYDPPMTFDADGNWLERCQDKRTEAGFLVRISQAGIREGRHLRLIFADWLEEHNRDHEARFQRALAQPMQRRRRRRKNVWIQFKGELICNQCRKHTTAGWHLDPQDLYLCPSCADMVVNG